MGGMNSEHFAINKKSSFACLSYTELYSLIHSLPLKGKINTWLTKLKPWLRRRKINDFMDELIVESWIHKLLCLQRFEAEVNFVRQTHLELKVM